VFVAEGWKMVSEVPAGYLVRAYVSESFERDKKEIGLPSGIPYEIVSDQVFREMADTVTPQGILAVVRQRRDSLEEVLGTGERIGKTNPHILLLEDIQDPGNLGTILRAGEGAGMTGIIMSKGTVDIYNPKVVRSTMGSIYRVPFLYVDHLADVMVEVKKTCVVYAAHLDAEKDYCQYQYRSGTAILIGNESSGLSDEISAYADHLVKIPLEGRVESLNAAVAAAVFMYEISRQRRTKE
jgi:TrmH family RNA methyltransferase